MFKFTQFLGAAAMLAGVQMASAQSEIATEAQISFSIDGGPTVHSQLSPSNPGGEYYNSPAITTGDGHNDSNYQSGSNQSTSSLPWNNELVSGTNQVSIESDSASLGTAFQAEGFDYYVDFHNAGAYEADLSLEIRASVFSQVGADGTFLTPAQEANSTGTVGYSFYDLATGANLSNGLFSQYVDQTGVATQTVSGFNVIGNTLEAANPLLFMGSGETIEMRIWSEATTYAQSPVPEPPAIFVGIVGVSCLLLRRKRA